MLISFEKLYLDYLPKSEGSTEYAYAVFTSKVTVNSANISTISPVDIDDLKRRFDIGDEIDIPPHTNIAFNGEDYVDVVGKYEDIIEFLAKPPFFNGIKAFEGKS